MRRLTLALAGLLVALLVAACGSASAEPPTPPASIDPSAVGIVADKLAFQQTEVSARAGTAFQIVFENKEGAPHNVAVYRTPDYKDPVSVGEIFSGPGSKAQSVPALTAGTYYFRCDVHPSMQGTLTVK